MAIQSTPAIWQLPANTAANKNELMTIRMQHYRFNQQHYLNDGTRVIPTIEALKHIFDAYDMFDLPVVVSANTYTLYVED